MEFIDALGEDQRDGSSNRRQAERKTLQFCRQVQRVLNLALADGGACGIPREVFVEAVTPAPDCGRLLVHVVTPPGCAMDEALSVLRQSTPRLRAEVAAATTRKRAPELSFVPVYAEGGEHE